MLAFLHLVYFKNRVEIPPQQKISIYEVTNMPTIGEFSINYEMTTPKSCHDVTTPIETKLYIFYIFIQLTHFLHLQHQKLVFSSLKG